MSHLHPSPYLIPTPFLNFPPSFPLPPPSRTTNLSNPIPLSTSSPLLSPLTPSLTPSPILPFPDPYPLPQCPPHPTSQITPTPPCTNYPHFLTSSSHHPFHNPTPILPLRHPHPRPTPIPLSSFQGEELVVSDEIKQLAKRWEPKPAAESKEGTDFKTVDSGVVSYMYDPVPSLPRYIYHFATTNKQFSCAFPLDWYIIGSPESCSFDGGTWDLSFPFSSSSI